MKLIITILIVILAMSNCKKDDVSNNDFDSFTISYKRASAWVGYSYDAIIDQTGFLQITEKNEMAKINRKSTYHLTEDDQSLIKSKLDTLTTIDIRDNYGFDLENAPTDLPVTAVIYKTNYKSDSTSIYFPKENEMPAKFEAFLITLQQVLLKYDTQ